MTATVADIRLAFGIALKCACSAMILCHNHPSGNSKASDADNQLTKRFREAGEIMDIKVLDHIILTNKSFYSYTDEMC
jgi:DNA repair protein RadC